MSLLNTLLRLGIISSLSDREAFINKTSQLIERYYDDSQTAERLAKVLATYLEDVKDNLNMSRAVKNSLNKTDVATKEDIAEINKILQDLIVELREQKNKNPDDGIS